LSLTPVFSATEYKDFILELPEDETPKTVELTEEEKREIIRKEKEEERLKVEQEAKNKRIKEEKEKKSVPKEITVVNLNAQGESVFAEMFNLKFII